MLVCMSEVGTLSPAHYLLGAHVLLCFVCLGLANHRSGVPVLK